jgi:hypothetical protein
MMAFWPQTMAFWPIPRCRAIQQCARCGEVRYDLRRWHSGAHAHWLAVSKLRSVPL